MSEATKERKELDEPPCSALEACKAAVSAELMSTLQGTDRTARTDDGFIRWGLVERRLHNIIEGYWPNTNGDAPR